MDTAKTLLKQLRYCERACETPEQLEQVRYWIELIHERRAGQPPADPIPSDPSSDQATPAAA